LKYGQAAFQVVDDEDDDIDIDVDVACGNYFDEVRILKN
jgi:hypothetical protein